MYLKSMKIDKFQNRPKVDLGFLKIFFKSRFKIPNTDIKDLQNLIS